MDARKPGALPMAKRIEHSENNYRKMMEVTSHEVFVNMFNALATLVYRNPVPREFPYAIKQFTFYSLDFIHSGRKVNASYLLGNVPHFASGEYKDNHCHFKFQIRKSMGMKEILQFESLALTKKECVCSSWDLFQKGCKCGAILSNKPLV